MSRRRSRLPWGGIIALVLIVALLVALAVWYGYYRCDLGNPTWPTPWWNSSCPSGLP